MSTLLSDERLVRRAAGGEERALEAIFDRYHQRLYRYCLAILGDPQDAQDALQNTMLKVLGALPGEGREIKLRPWLYRIAHNESIDLLRRRRDTCELDAELAAPGPSLADELSTRQRLRRLLDDLDELPERQRGALVMRELAGLDFAGIAAALGTSPAVARQTLYEARLSLHQMDEGRDMDCVTVTRALSDGDGRVTRRRDIRAHLRACPDCRRFRTEIEGRERDLAALAPLPTAAAAGLLQALLGGGASTGSGSAAATVVAGGAAKTLGSSAALKGAAAVLAVAAIGTGAAQRGGLIDLGLPGGGGSKAPSQQSSETSESSASGAGARTSSPAAPGTASPQRSADTPKSISVGSGTQGAGQGLTSAAPAASGNQESGAAQEGAPANPVVTEGESTTHPNGKGHEKQHPPAATHGRQTAATHRHAGRESSEKEHPSHPEHPEHPAHPNNGGEDEPPVEQEPAHEGNGKARPAGAEAGESGIAPGAEDEGASEQGESAAGSGAPISSRP